MKKQSLPETDYQTRCIEAERKARDFESAYFKAEERYSNLMDAYIKLKITPQQNQRDRPVYSGQDGPRDECRTM